MRVYITGTGVVSAIGMDTKETLTSLVSERTGITEKNYPDLNRSFYTGSVNLNNEELAKVSDFNDPLISRSSLLGIKAAKECWGSNKNSPSIKTGIISGTSVGGMDKSEVFYRKKIANLEPSISDLQYHDSGSVTEKIADSLGITGYINTISTACSSGNNAIMHGARLIKAGKLDRVLVGGVDSLSDFTISGFKSLMIYNDNWCCPFDENRNGLNLGEGAGFLLLESEASIKQTHNKILGEVTGYNNSSDAYHQTATSPDAKGATIAISKALEKAGINPSEINYVSAHGTGTKNNDLTESIALKNVFGDIVPPFSSTKAYTGHTLAASGAIEAVISLLSIQNSILFPNLNFTAPIKETQMSPIFKVKKDQEVNHVLSNSFGFGGNCTSIILSKYSS